MRITTEDEHMFVTMSLAAKLDHEHNRGFEAVTAMLEARIPQA
jgi:hypothetical protein